METDFDKEAEKLQYRNYILRSQIDAKYPLLQAFTNCEQVAQLDDPSMEKQFLDQLKGFSETGCQVILTGDETEEHQWQY